MSYICSVIFYRENSNENVIEFKDEKRLSKEGMSAVRCNEGWVVDIATINKTLDLFTGFYLQKKL